MFLLESPHRGDSNEYKHYTIFNIKKKITLNYPKYLQRCDFSMGLKNEFETAVVNEPSVFEPLKFYCSNVRHRALKFKMHLGLKVLQCIGSNFPLIIF